MHRGAGRPGAAARDRARRSRRTTTRRRGRPTRRSCSTRDTNLNVWVLDVASGQAKVVGRDPWMVPQRTLNPVVEPGLEVGRVREPAELALPRDLRRATSRPARRSRSPTASPTRCCPAWDASGKYLWFLASTDFGLRSQWLDMTSYDRDGDVRAVPRGAEEGRAEPAAAGERRRPGCAERCARQWRRWRRWPGRARRCAGDRAGGRRRRRSARRAGRSRAARAGHRADRFRRPAAAHHRGAGRAGAAVLAAEGRCRRHGLLPRGRGGRRPGGEPAAAARCTATA